MKKRKLSAEKESAYLQKLYYDAGEPQSFTGLGPLMYRIKQDGVAISRSKVEKLLRHQDAYAKHFPIRRTFKRNRVVALWIDETWMADLVDLQSLSKHNKGCRYLLTVVDVLSKFAWAVPLKNKNGATVATAFGKNIIAISNRTPSKLYTDQGKVYDQGPEGIIEETTFISHFRNF